MAKKNIRSFENGITIVALVITIMIMLILSGIVLNNAIRENGIIKNANSSLKQKFFK